MSEAHKILVVDDAADNRDLLERRLERAGFQVTAVDSGIKAIQAVDQQRPDLIILDWMMPGLSGTDVLKALRRKYSTLDLPVIMATAKSQPEDLVLALELGANDYVTKPFEFPVVLARIQSQLRAKAQAFSTKGADPVRLRMNDLRPGLVLGEKYRLEEEIGSGAFGIVYRATHLAFQQPVALKILNATIDEKDSEGIDRLRLEGSSAFRLQHPNAVAILDFAVVHGLAFLVMELLDGSTLEGELKRHPMLPLQRAVDIVVPICEVLAQAHSLGVIHRDIKPANIFLQATQRGEVVKVLDFGIAKLVGDSAISKNLTVDESILGTPIYMAPERLGGRNYGGYADVYSVGIMLYQMVTGTLPFHVSQREALAIAVQHLTAQPERLRTHLPDAPIAFEEVVMSTLRKAPEERPSAGELAVRLRQSLDPQGSYFLRQASEDEPTTAVIALPRGRKTIGVPPPLDKTPLPRPLPASHNSEAATRRLPRIVTARIAFSFADLIEPPPSLEVPEAPLPVHAPRDVYDDWT